MNRFADCLYHAFLVAFLFVTSSVFFLCRFFIVIIEAMKEEDLTGIRETLFAGKLYID